MGGENLSIDQREQRLVAAERAIARLRELQMRDLAELDVAQIATADGSRSLSEWVAARLDQGVESARSLVRTMRRLQDRPDLQEQLADGSVSFDRVEALSRVKEDVGLMEWADISAIRREASRRARVKAESEYFSARDRYHVMQPSLDESRWKYWGALDGPSGALVDKVLSEAADALPELPDGTKGTRGWRQATALVECLVSDDPAPAQVTVIVDAKEAAGTNGEAGVTLESGPNVGRQALQTILCDAETEVIARTEDGRTMDYGRRQRTARPSLRRALLARYNYTCGADGCTSRHRLQVHHLTPWARGGETNQDDLVVLCWFHHQVVVHERGFEIVPHPDLRRIRFRRPKDPPRSR
jgi:5-methylcytosine-specific restriction endonuclease McrA